MTNTTYRFQCPKCEKHDSLSTQVLAPFTDIEMYDQDEAFAPKGYKAGEVWPGEWIEFALGEEHMQDSNPTQCANCKYEGRLALFKNPEWEEESHERT